MSDEASVAALREALQATLQSHQRYGKAAPCDCSLCFQIRDALTHEAGAAYRKRLREECAEVADWAVQELVKNGSSPEDSNISLAVKTARQIANRIRMLDALSI